MIVNLTNFAYESHYIEFLYLAIFVFPFFGYIASLSFVLTLMLLFTIFPAVYYTHIFIKQKYSYTDLMYTWTITSILYIFVVFEVYIVTLRMVTFLEHTLFIMGYTVVSSCLQTPKKRDISTSDAEPVCEILEVKNYERINEIDCAKKIRLETSEKMLQWLEDGQESNEPFEMDKEQLLRKNSISNKNNFVHLRNNIKKDYGYFWINSYIGHNNRKFFIFVLAVLPLWLSFTANIILTCVCKCYLFYNTIVLPGDCSAVYDSVETAMLFVFAMYCGMIALVVLLYAIYEVWASLWFRSKDGDTLYNIKRSDGFIGRCYRFLKSLTG